MLITHYTKYVNTYHKKTETKNCQREITPINTKINVNKKLRLTEHDTTAVVDPGTVGASVDTILVFDTLKHTDLQFIMETSNDLDTNFKYFFSKSDEELNEKAVTPT